jgi:hypothetical protein
MKKLLGIGLLVFILVIGFAIVSCGSDSESEAEGDSFSIYGRNAKNEDVVVTFTAVGARAARLAYQDLQSGDKFVIRVAGAVVSEGQIVITQMIYVTFLPSSGGSTAAFEGTMSGGNLTFTSPNAPAGLGEPGGFAQIAPAPGGKGSES